MQLTEFFAFIGKLLLQLGQTILAGGIRFFLQRQLFDFHTANDALQLINFLRGGVNLHTQAGSCLIDQVNSLIRQETVGDVAIRQLRCRNERGVHNADTVVDLVTLFQATQNTDGVFHRRLSSIDLLETAFQCGVLFDVFAILIQGGCTY